MLDTTAACLKEIQPCTAQLSGIIIALIYYKKTTIN